MTLGAYPQMGLAAAHTCHAKAEEKQEKGTDPGAELEDRRKAERNAETIAELIDIYLEKCGRELRCPGGLPDCGGNPVRRLAVEIALRLPQHPAQR